MSSEKASPQTTQTQLDPAILQDLPHDQPPVAPIVKKRRKRTKTGKRFKVPVPSSGKHQTFIDIGCETDAQGYPIYPNNETVFVKKPNEDITNFGHIAYPHTQKTSGANDDRPWKTTWYTCLGLLDCDNKACKYAAPPPTGDRKAAEHILKHPRCPAAECQGQHRWTTCTTTSCRVDLEKETGWAILRHSGTHCHVWPVSKKADPLAMEKLTAEVVKNPKAGPMVLQVGQAGEGRKITPSVDNLHPAFSHRSRLGYLRRTILYNTGIMTEQESKGGGDSFPLDIQHWGTKGLWLISMALTGSNVHVTFQIEWMAQQLVRRDPETEKVYSGGLLSDVTYRFFKNGYLLTTSMYSDLLHRWIPVQLTWMARLDVTHYKGHFTLLMKQMFVDFSSAQKQGFVGAYMDVFNKRDRDKAMSKLKGCCEHYRQSITRITRNRGVVPAGDNGTFEDMALNLLEPDKPNGLNLAQRFESLAKAYPAAKPWIAWWNTADIEAMLFCARRRLPLDDPPRYDECGNEIDELPETTNGQESMHRQYYILTDGKCTLLQGLIQLLLFAKSLEKDYDQLLRGIPVKYGNNWESVVETMGWSKQRASRRPEANDGRPPDTNKVLFGTKKLGRPRGAPNVHRDPHSSYQSYWACNNETGKKNCCWATASLESFFPLFSPLWIIGSTGKKTDIVTKLTRHYSARVSSEIHGGKGMRSILSRGLTSLQKAAQQLSPSFVTDRFASADLFIDYFLVPARGKPASPIAKLFPHQVIKEFRCTQYPSHIQNEIVTQYGISITNDMFHDANLKYSGIEELIQMWVTDGLFSTNPRCCTAFQKSFNENPKQLSPLMSDEDIEVQVLKENPAKDVPTLYERAHLDFSSSPMHVYFHLAGVMGLAESDKHKFMGDMKWPECLEFNGNNYKIVSRGFWGEGHFWCKVVRTLDGATGVYYYNDLLDDGRAQLLGRDMGLISGAQPNTSWVIYSRQPTREEQTIIDNGIARIAKKNPTGDTPFGSADDFVEVEDQIAEIMVEEPGHEVIEDRK
ncbi:uncharacterized protein MELLADRAFT_92442 [Melampsora larici-populina 98AG31]|uniref:GCM domain-containing protein n=1 Tax=Melampsora larici-populina (strain 98AG31 / pathotype 3-4-7) TaxID=747676 RepID=F4R9P1_MELLP|nr:uncharacterized protein MELLADRAFT_92442 [Melampsora larici-populina 98AG31]EGG11013.1 hypothetical protein MELLADRAFT_92442 [Melampsora larici-populina 98AG31]